jgi:hypothetical protein
MNKFSNKPGGGGFGAARSSKFGVVFDPKDREERTCPFPHLKA